ncbi:histidine kinase [Emticicia sp. BO119]|uniref:histidine kinase n=1 Tax=Emticicia sp. BO119 TaxID=2757768 RepID=UPI0015F06E54|nr:histidine kinase [Emticicia sp. BO119]MBA4850751.1 histidine kinase [Emticicia sp. BO119]
MKSVLIVQERLVTRKSRPFICLLLLFVINSYAQKTYLIKQAVKDSILLNNYAEILYEPTETITINNIRNQPFIPFKDFKLEHSSLQKTYNHWLRFKVHNSTSKNEQLLFDYGLYHYIYLYDFNGQNYRVKKAGMLVKPDEKIFSENKYVVPVTIPAHKSKEIYVRINDRNGIYKDSKISLLTYDFEETLRSQSFFKSRKDLFYSASFLAIGLFLILFCIIQFSQTREKAFVYYALYLLGLYLYFIRRIEALTDTAIIFSYFPKSFLTSEVPLNILPNIWYLLFCQYLLNLTSTHHPTVYKIFRWQIKFLTAYFIFDCFLQYIMNEYALSLTIYRWVKLSMMPITTYSIILIFRLRNVVATYIALGTSILFIFLVISFITAIVRRMSGEAYVYYIMDFPYVETGIFAENLLFVIAFIAKIKQVYIERNQAQKQLIAQLQANQHLQVQLNNELEQLVYEKTRALETETQQRLLAEFNQKLSKAELKALQSQINPHFIFNSLNSIKNYILTNKPNDAAKYLTDFANLIRSVLQQSQQSFISLKDELEILELYIRLEQMRFENRFDFSYNIDEQVDTTYIKIPALLLQPYVENAIWHGLMHKNTKGHLKIEVKLGKDEVLCMIEDNGIGRKKSAEIHSQTTRPHKSMGLQINSERLKVLHELHKLEIEVEIFDLESLTREPDGTRVLIHFPL